MLDASDDQIGQLAANLTRGSIVAAAGCGKTEQIARAVALSNCRRLILTHTHAGVDAISKRLKVLRVPKEKYRVDTIAGWCLRFSASFPKRSGIAEVAPRSMAEWNAVYAAAAQLIRSGAVSGVIESSYGGVFVDEYQDCTRLQHDVVKILAEQMPVCVFGDPLQAIFDFRGQEPVDWEVEVFKDFPKEGELTTPWRWKNAGNDELAEWLKAVRRDLEHDGPVDLTNRPACVKWSLMPADERFRQAVVIRECLAVMGDTNNGNLIVIGDSANVNGRAYLAKSLAKKGFSNVEAINCKELYAAGKTIEQAVGIESFKALLAFVSKCMTGTEKAALEKAVQSRIAGRRQGQAKFRELLPIIDEIVSAKSDKAMLAFLQAMQVREGAHTFRKELFSCMCSALQIKSVRGSSTLLDAIWEVQNRIRHAGRKFPKRSIGSTLLVKGLEFDSSVIVYSGSMTCRDWYVALTRATKAIRVISPAERFIPCT